MLVFKSDVSSGPAWLTEARTDSEWFSRRIRRRDPLCAYSLRAVKTQSETLSVIADSFVVFR